MTNFKNILFGGLGVFSAMVLLGGCGSTSVSDNSTSQMVNDGQTEVTNSATNGGQAPVQESGDECGDGALLTYNCWTSRFPATPTERSDVTCGFSISCCGEVKNGWQTVYPEAAGARGLVDGGSISSNASCKTLSPLDVDEDGVPNESDPTPINDEKEVKVENWLPWVKDNF